MNTCIRCLGGPADGVRLHLARTPTFLRVVRDPDDKWDALDLLEDEPKSEEAIYAYRLVPGSRTTVHLLCSDRHGRYGRLEHLADYRVVDPQPADTVMRDRGKWQASCWEQVGREVLK